MAADRRLPPLAPALVSAALLLGALAAAPAAAAQAPVTRCGFELSRGIAVTPGGPFCGTDEGDDAGFGGEDNPVGFFGENGHDTFEGSRYADVAGGGPGNDEIHGGRGNDAIDGGDDSDVLHGGLGDDALVERRFGIREHLYGGPGNDAVAGGRGTDDVYGGTGDDRLFGGSGSDRLYGGPGDDVLYGGPNRDSFDCGPGFDVVYRMRTSGPTRNSTDRADAGIPRSRGCERIVTGDPTARFPLRDVLGTNGPDELFGSPGSDLIQGKGAGDRLFAGRGDDELEGDGATRQGADLLMGGSGDDRLAGRAGGDRLYGDARSSVAGPPGDDELAGGSGRDHIVGGPGRDLVLAAYDGDTVLAGSGDDVVNLLGGDTSDPNGRVAVDCGRGNDTVVINPARRGSFKGCENFTRQFHEADFGVLFRPSPEAIVSGLGPGAGAAMTRLGRARADGPARTGAAARGRRAQAPEEEAPAAAAGSASAPSISGDGRRVAFSSDAPNLIADDANAERTDPFVRDLGENRTLLAAGARGGRSPARGARLRRGPGGGISADGNTAVFSSNSHDLAGRVPAYAIFRRDIGAGRNAVACRAGNDDSESPVTSADGRHVAFESRATNLAGPDLNQQTDVYWCDTATGELRRVSTPLADGVNTSGTSLQPAISPDGRFVVFTSDSGGLVAGDGGRAGVYWRDMATGELRLVDVPPGASSSNGSGQNPKVSADGRFVVFDSDATDLPGGELNGPVVDVFRKDMSDGSVQMVSGPAGGGAGEGDAIADSVSADGNHVAFSSTAPNLVAGDGNGRVDVFVRNLAAGTLARASTRADGSDGFGPSYSAAVSDSGRHVAFVSRSTGLVAEARGVHRAWVYRKDLATGAVELATTGIDTTPRSLIAEPSGVLARRRVRLVAGTAEDNGRVQRVDVAVSRRVGANRCVWVGRGTRLVRGRCDRPLYVRARLFDGLRWTLTVRGVRLPRGTYTVRARATDAGGRTEPVRRGRNLAGFRLK